jgi:inner membrane transporter RhtA
VSSRSSAIVSLLVAMLSFQAGASIAKQLFPAIGAPGTTALRLGLSALIVGTLQRPWRHVPSPGARPLVLIYGVSLGTMNFVFYMALRTIPLGTAVALEFTGPLAVAFAASGRRIDFVWVTLAAGGVFFLLPIAPQASALDVVGVLYALAAGVCWALYIVFGQKAGLAHGASASTWGMLIAALVAMPIGIALAGRSLLAPRILLVGLAVAVLSSALPYTLEMIALRRLSARTFGTLMSLDPAAAALMGLVALQERLTPTQWLAIAAITVASIGVAGSDRHEEVR